MWADYLVQLEAGRLQKKAEAVKQRGRKEGDRPQLRWDDCIKMDLRKVEMDAEWGEKAADREKAAYRKKWYCRTSLTSFLKRSNEEKHI